MSTTPLPNYGIWTTDIDGKRVMGFTPDQFLSVWQARADLEAENKRLREALTKAAAALEARCAFGDADATLAALKDTK